MLNPLCISITEYTNLDPYFKVPAKQSVEAFVTRRNNRIAAAKKTSEGARNRSAASNPSLRSQCAAQFVFE